MGNTTTSCLMLFTIFLALAGAAPNTSGSCENGCHCYNLPRGGRAANCSRFDTSHSQLPSDLRVLRVLPGAPGLASFLTKRIPHSFNHLEELYLSNNELEPILLKSLCKLKRLRILDLSFCDVSDPKEITKLVKQCGHLAKLKLTGNSLTAIPALESSSLDELDLSYCRISSIDADAFRKLSVLRRLILSGNRLSNFDAVNLPKSLRFLDLSNNAVVHLSPQRLTMLHRLDIAGNPVHCTCSLAELRNKRTGEYVALGRDGVCGSPEHLRGLGLGEVQRLCELKEDDMVTRKKRQADDYDLEGSGDDGEFADNEEGDDDFDDDYSELDPLTGTEDKTEVKQTESGVVSSGGDELKEAVTINPNNGGHESKTPETGTARSLEDDIYIPSVSPPVPASVDPAAKPSENESDSGIETPPEAANSEVETKTEIKTHLPSDTDKLVEEQTEKVSLVGAVVTEAPLTAGEKTEIGSVDPENVGNNVDDYDYEYGDDMDLDNETDPDEETEAPSGTVTALDDSLKNIPTEDDKINADGSAILPDAAKNDSGTVKGIDRINTVIEEDVNKIFEGEERNTEPGGQSEISKEPNEVLLNAEIGRSEKDGIMEANMTGTGNKSLNKSADTFVPAKIDTSSELSAAVEPEGSGAGDDEDSGFATILPDTLDFKVKEENVTTTVENEDEPLLIDDIIEEDNETVSNVSTEPVISDSRAVDEKVERKEARPVVESFPPSVNWTTQPPGFIDEEDYDDEGSGTPIFGLNGDMDDDDDVQGNETGIALGNISENPRFSIEDDAVKADEMFLVESERDMETGEESNSTADKITPKSAGGLHSLLLPGVVTEGVLTTKPPDSDVKSSSPENEANKEAPFLSTKVDHETTTRSTPSPIQTDRIPNSEMNAELPLLPPNVSTGEISDVETVGPPEGNETARVVAPGSTTEQSEETPLNSAGSYVVLGIIMALVVFLLGYAVMRSRRSNRRAAKSAREKDAEAGGQQEGRELKEISKPLLAQPAQANGKGDHLQPLVTKPANNPDLKEDDGEEEPVTEASPRIHIYESLNGGDKEHVPVVTSHPSPDGRAISRLPDATDGDKPSMYAATDIFPQEVVTGKQGQRNGDAQPTTNGLSTFTPNTTPVSPRSGRVKVVAREDPDSVPKKPVFVVNHGPNAATEHV